MPRPSKSTRPLVDSGVKTAFVSAVPGLSKTTSTLLMLLSTAVMLPLLFPPFYCFFLAPFALVPFCVCILRRPMRARFLLAYYGLGVAFFLPNLFWLAPNTVAGLIGLALFCGIYFPIFAIGIHRLIVHFRLPATVAVPLVWTAVEYLRGSFPLGGFPWFLLGNCLTPATVLIQSADIFGVWGLTFVIALLNGFIVDVLRLPLWETAKRGPRRFSPVIGSLTAGVAVLMAALLGYGVFRLSQQTTHAGPRVAVIQENIPQSLKLSGDGRVFERYFSLTQQAAQLSPKPDLIVWPETMLPGFGNIEYLNTSDHAFQSFDAGSDWQFWAYLRDRSLHYFSQLEDVTDTNNVPILVGSLAMIPNTTVVNSVKENRTLLLAPHVGPVDYYAKVHLVPFGEFIPFHGVPVVGNLMYWFMPAEMKEASLNPGKRWTRFALPTSSYGDRGLMDYPPTYNNAAYTFGTPICFEDTMPEPSRQLSAPQYAGGRKADFLINVSNDGWFHWIELDQHLQMCQLRAVENRIAVARSVNTGNSGFIDSNGRIVKLVTAGDGSSIGAVGFESMDIQIDSRVTFFSRIGDLFPIILGVVSTLLVGWTFVRPRRGPAT